MELLRTQLKEKESQLQTLSSERDALVESERGARKLKDELEAELEMAKERAASETQQRANLQSALEVLEQQVKDKEKQITELRRKLDEARVRYDKLDKDYRAAQTAREAAEAKAQKSDAVPEGMVNAPYVGGMLLRILTEKNKTTREEAGQALLQLLKCKPPMEQDLEKSIQENITPKYFPDTGVRRSNQGFFGALF